MYLAARFQSLKIEVEDQTEMRLFIAIQLSEAIRDELCHVQEQLKQQGVAGNYTSRENLHLTLVFIGEYADWQRVLDIVDSLDMRPFEIKLDGFGAFDDLWWVGIEDSSPLQDYVKALRHALAVAGIPFDKKRFRPHITILRKADSSGKRLKGISGCTAGMTVDHASLMRSDRGRSGMIYTEIS